MVEALITGWADLWLGVEKRSTNDGIEVTLRLKSNAHYVLHWAFARRRPGTWQAPPDTVWPSETRAFSKEAAQTPFSDHQGERGIVIRLREKLKTPFLVFDLFCPDTRRWENNQGKDYYVALRRVCLGPKTGLPPQSVSNKCGRRNGMIARISAARRVAGRTRRSAWPC